MLIFYDEQIPYLYFLNWYKVRWFSRQNDDNDHQDLHIVIIYSSSSIQVETERTRNDIKTTGLVMTFCVIHGSLIHNLLIYLLNTMQQI